jgi:hypothetical protein
MTAVTIAVFEHAISLQKMNISFHETVTKLIVSNNITRLTRFDAFCVINDEAFQDVMTTIVINDMVERVSTVSWSSAEWLCRN